MSEAPKTALQQILEDHDLSQAAVADILGISPTGVSFYVKGTRAMPEEHMAALMRFISDRAAQAPAVPIDIPVTVRDRMSREEFNAHIYAMAKHCERGGLVYDQEHEWPVPYTSPEQRFPYRLSGIEYDNMGKAIWGRTYAGECPGVTPVASGIQHQK